MKISHHVFDRLCNPSALGTLMVGLLLMFTLAGCGTTNFRTQSGSFTGKSPVTAIYIYSFLDLREGTIGTNFLAEVRRQLTNELESRGIKTKQLWFAEAATRNQYSLQSNQAASGTSMRVPVNEVVTSNRDDENSFNASHRIILVPTSVTRTNEWHFFTVRWDLFDAKSNEHNWTTISNSSHMKLFLGDENPVERARIFVNGAVSEMEKSGVLPPKTPNS